MIAKSYFFEAIGDSSPRDELSDETETLKHSRIQGIGTRKENEGESRGKVENQERDEHDATRLGFATVCKVEDLGAEFHWRKAGMLVDAMEKHCSVGSRHLPEDDLLYVGNRTAEEGQGPVRSGQ